MLLVLPAFFFLFFRDVSLRFCKLSFPAFFRAQRKERMSAVAPAPAYVKGGRERESFRSTGLGPRPTLIHFLLVFLPLLTHSFLSTVSHEFPCLESKA